MDEQSQTPAQMCVRVPLLFDAANAAPDCLSSHCLLPASQINLREMDSSSQMRICHPQGALLRTLIIKGSGEPTDSSRLDSLLENSRSHPLSAPLQDVRTLILLVGCALTSKNPLSIPFLSLPV